VKPLGTVMFLAKFFELQGLMIIHNSALKKSHPYSSEPISWPFALRGISFWEKEKGWRQIYLLSNPFGWLFAIIGPFLFTTMWVMDRIFLQRGIDDLGPCLRRFWDRSCGFLFMTWLLHYAPFFLMGRMLFLHHYLPAYIFSVLLSVLFVDVLARDFMSPKLNYPPNTRISVWRSTSNSLAYTIFILVIAGLVIFGFVYFAPLAYGLGFPSREVLQTRKWLRSWDLQYAK
jgi:dolichyl-phosphate-mannose-protein mannosyltransferase